MVMRPSTKAAASGVVRDSGADSCLRIGSVSEFDAHTHCYLLAVSYSLILMASDKLISKLVGRRESSMSRENGDGLEAPMRRQVRWSSGKTLALHLEHRGNARVEFSRTLCQYKLGPPMFF